MNNYSIVRIGKDYVVQANEKSVFKITSLRRAVRLVTDAAELLDLQPPPLAPPDEDAEPSTARDPGLIPDPSKVP